MDWSYFWLHIGGDVVAITVLGCLIKILLDKHFKHQELTLSAKLATEQEALKAELSMGLSTFNNRHSLYCIKQEEAISETYSQLWRCFFQLAKVMESVDLPSYEKEVENYENVHNKAAEHFLSRCFYFTDDLEERVTRLFHRFNDIAFLIKQGHVIEKRGTTYMIQQENLEEAKKEINTLLRELKELFKIALATEQTWVN